MGKGNRIRAEREEAKRPWVAPPEGVASAVQIKCPVTNRFVNTGFEMSVDAFNSSKVSDSTFNCSACGRIHKWNDVESVLAN